VKDAANRLVLLQQQWELIGLPGTADRWTLEKELDRVRAELKPAQEVLTSIQDYEAAVQHLADVKRDRAQHRSVEVYKKVVEDERAALRRRLRQNGVVWNE